MGNVFESLERNIRLLTDALAGSGINVNAQFTIDDRVGINDANGNPISPATEGSLSPLNANILHIGGQASGINTSVASLRGDLPFTQAMNSGLLHVTYRTITNSNTRQTALTASPGKRLQVFEISAANYSAASVFMEAYYGTGNDITVNPSGALLNVPLTNTSMFPGKIWENGSQLSSAGDILSVRTSGVWPNQPDIASSGLFTFRYREV